MRRGDLEFVFEGRTLTARQGDSVAAALFANGVRVFGRSAKYHRPRGYRCGRGHCSACAMRVDGLPGVRTCVTPVQAGMRVAREHAWPDAGTDLLRVAEALAPLMPPGFYYRWFRRSPRLFAAFERGLAHVAGQGRPPSLEAARRLATARCQRRDDIAVLVVGGGAAGLSAAVAAAEEGAAVLLVEQDERLGGRLADAPDAQAMRTLVGRVRGHAGIETLTAAEAIAWYEEGVLAVDRRPDLLLVRPAAVVLATGGYDRGLPFAGWDLPGVMSAGGAALLLHRYEVAPGSRAVVVTTNDEGHLVARDLRDAGVEIACVADCRPPQAIRRSLARDAEAAGIALLTGVEGARAHGIGSVSALSLRLGGDGPPRIVRHECDLVCISAGTRPADDLAYQSVARGSLVLAADTSLEPVAGAGAPAAAGTPVLGPWLAGSVVGAETAAAAIAQGRVAGAAAARAAAAPAT